MTTPLARTLPVLLLLLAAPLSAAAFELKSEGYRVSAAIAGTFSEASFGVGAHGRAQFSGLRMCDAELRFGDLVVHDVWELEFGLGFDPDMGLGDWLPLWVKGRYGLGLGATYELGASRSLAARFGWFHDFDSGLSDKVFPAIGSYSTMYGAITYDDKDWGAEVAYGRKSRVEGSVGTFTAVQAWVRGYTARLELVGGQFEHTPHVHVRVGKIF